MTPSYRPGGYHDTATRSAIRLPCTSRFAPTHAPSFPHVIALQPFRAAAVRDDCRQAPSPIRLQLADGVAEPISEATDTASQRMAVGMTLTAVLFGAIAVVGAVIHHLA